MLHGLQIDIVAVIICRFGHFDFRQGALERGDPHGQFFVADADVLAQQFQFGGVGFDLGQFCLKRIGVFAAL